MSPVSDILHEKTQVYSCEARLPGTPKAAFFLVLALAAVCALLFSLASRLPYSGVLKLAVLALTAVGIYAVLRKGTFSVTYVLTDDNTLTYVTRYGFLSRETAHIALDRAKIDENKIKFKNRTYDFYPDEKLSELLSGYKIN